MQATQSAYERLYPREVALSLSSDAVLRNAQLRWQEQYDALRRAALLQGQIGDGVATDSLLLAQAMDRSRLAGGALEVAQAGNELVGLSVKQALALQSLLAAQHRADTLQRARDIASEDEAIATAHRLADIFAKDAALRDREGLLPIDELDAFSQSGLWGINVPKAYGGLGASYVTVANVFRIIAAADPSLGQLPQNHFCIVDLSAFYFDVLKDRLYISAPKSHGRRSAQTAVWRIGEALVRLLAPIMSFTCEEIWQYLPQSAGREQSVHLASFPSLAEITAERSSTSKSDDDWSTLRSVRDDVLSERRMRYPMKLVDG